MNHSLLTADSTTHLKIVTLALVFGIAVTLIGSTARFTDKATVVVPIIKASKPAVIPVAALSPPADRRFANGQGLEFNGVHEHEN